MLLYRLAESQLVKLASPFLLDTQNVGGLALTTGQVGFVYGTAGLLMLTVGGLLGGFIAARDGLKKWLFFMVLAINLPDAVYIYLAHYQPDNYWIVIFLMMVGLYTVISRGNLIKKVIGLNIFQVSVFLLYISMSTVEGGAPPIITEGVDLYSNPLPHVLILTAIVVGVATTALALALVVRIKESYGTIEEDEIHEQDHSL